ncbi:MAG: NAD(P)/FAD-dependent oxidoreductase [bacterium]|nr:NAD(P)/FAD-dependent oxidoreductase [bacterium]
MSNSNTDEVVDSAHRYDYLIVGTGNAALTFAALMANSGKRVLMFEAHDIPGGYAQSFKWGEDFYFCGQVHYIWGCAPGGRIYEFLKRVGLEKDITFELHNPDMYDRMVLPDGKRVGIPYGWNRLVTNIEKAYPGQGPTVKRFTNLIEKIRAEVRNLPDVEHIKWYQYITQGWRYPTLLKYRKRTLQQVFDEFKVPKEAQLVLIANAGDMMEPPERLSIFTFVGLFGGYNTGAYYPTKHFKYYIDRLAEFITSHKGCRILYKAEVTNIVTEGERVVGVETNGGKIYTAKNYICNGDPQMFAEMMGKEKFPEEYRKKLEYVYSPSGIMIYLGLKNANLREHGFGTFNTWHCEGWDMNQMWKEMGKGDFSNPWIFISTPTLHTSDKSTTPADCDIMEIAAYTEYGWLHSLREKDYAEYEKKKNELAEKMLDLVEKYYYPELRSKIVTKCVGSASSNEFWVKAPRGNAYGATFTPDQVGPGRLKAGTPWKNFWWCNATSGYAGMHGTASTGMDLYMQLTGDTFYNEKNSPTDDEKAEAAYAYAKHVK